jgi:hypothetical protein
MADSSKDELDRKVRDAAMQIIDETLSMLHDASPTIKQRLVTTLFGKVLATTNLDDSDTLNDLRREMQDMFNAAHSTEEE